MNEQNFSQREGKLVIIAAPSGGGKTSVIKKFLSKHQGMIHSVSCTTRPMRIGEVDGKDYHFIEQKVFEDGIVNDRFAEWARVHNHFYGTPKETLDGHIRDGHCVLLDLDVVGSLNLKRLYGEKAVTIFILPPSMEELKRRLSLRATDAPYVQELRLKNALTELTCKDKFDYQVVNDDLDRACSEIEKIISVFE